MLENSKASPEKMKLVSRYMTPYAALLVLMGLYFGAPPKIEFYLALGILVISLGVNIGSMIGLIRDPARASMIRDLRVAINVVCNFWLIYILLPYWPQIWLLLLLVVIALAVYDTPESTVFFSYAFACLLLVVAYLRGVPLGVKLGTILMNAATLVFTGIFVSQLISGIQSSSGGKNKMLSQKLKLVSFSMTPYAVALVLLGLIFGYPNPMEVRWAIGILLVSILVNLSAMVSLEKLSVQQSSLIRNARVVINVICNFGLIYILLPYWPNIWMLLLLSVIALAVYDSREATMLYGVAFSALLILVAYSKGTMSGVHLGETLIDAVTLIVISLFINRLVSIIESEDVAPGKAAS